MSQGARGFRPWRRGGTAGPAALFVDQPEVLAIPEMYLEGRSERVVPGKAINKMLRPVGVTEFADDSKALRILSHWTHWIYGAAWGAL